MIWALKDGEKILAIPKEKALCPICKEKVIAKCGSIKIWHWSHESLKDCDSWSEGETEWHKSWKDNFPKEQQEVVVSEHRADIKLPSNRVIELQNSSISPEEIQERELFYGNMVWLLNGKTLCSGLNLKEKTGYFTFSWKHPSKSLWIIDKPFYIDMSYMKKELQDKEDDNFEKLGYVYEVLQEKFGKNPNEYSETESKGKYSQYFYDSLRAKYGDYIYQTYRKWEELSREARIIEKRFEDLNNGEIFLIKKLYKNLPCGGWGILLTKEEFLKQVKEW